MSLIKLFIVDDHEMMRIGLREALADAGDVEVIGESSGYLDGLEKILASPPDVALLDVRLGDGSGVELCREVQNANPSVRCLMYTSATDDDPLYESILAGAVGYLLKDAPRSELITAIRTVAAGGSLLDPAVTGRVLTRIREETKEPKVNLTEQEARVLDLIADGLTNSEIAGQMFLAEQTVKNYVSKVLMKLDMRRTQAALYAAGLHKRGESDI